MENFFIFKNEITNTELLSYLSFNIFYFLGIILNFVLFIFFKRKINVKRTSDFITTGTFCITSLILASIYTKNFLTFPEFNFELFSGVMCFNLKVTALQLLINLFFMFFIFSTYRLTRKARFKTPIINSTLLSAAFISSLIIQIQNDILSYLLLDVVVFLIYRFASDMRIRKDGFYSLDFLLKTLCADILFFSFYILGLILKDTIQLDIIKVCLTCAFFLKIGIFPVFNYSSSPHYKTNIPYSILVFCFLPQIGFITFEKIVLNFGFTNEIYQITTAIFLAMVMLCSALAAFKTKNLIRFFANISYCGVSFCIAAYLSGIEFSCAHKLMLQYGLVIFGLYSLCAVLKINLKCEKISFSTVYGIFLNNRIFALLFSLLLLATVNVLPCGILKYYTKTLREIYAFDNFSIFFIFFAVLAGVLILFNTLKLIQYIYSINKKITLELFHKKTAHNYALVCLIILFLTAMLYL